MTAGTIPLTDSSAPTVALATAATVTAIAASRRGVRGLIVVMLGVATLVVCLAVRYAVNTGAWERAYARHVMPDVAIDPSGLMETPAAATVRDGHIVDFRAPVR